MSKNFVLSLASSKFATSLSPDTITELIAAKPVLGRTGRSGRHPQIQEIVLGIQFVVS